jgi:hypothetical protein
MYLFDDPARPLTLGRAVVQMSDKDAAAIKTPQGFKAGVGAVARSIALTSGGKVSGETPLTYDGHPGVEYRVDIGKTPTGPRSGQVRVVLAGDRLVALLVSGGGATPPPEADGFLNSLKIGR